MPTFELDFEVFCGTCGAGLCFQSKTDRTRSRGMPYVSVDACEACLDKARDEKDVDIAHLQREIKDLQEQLKAAETELQEHPTQ